MYYLVLYKDGTLNIFGRKQEKCCHQEGTKIFETSKDTTIVDISEWIGSCYQMCRKIKETTWEK